MVFLVCDPGNAGSCGFPPICKAMCQWWGSCHEHVSDSSTCFVVDVFSIIQSIAASQLVSEFLSEGIELCVDVYLMHPWEERKLEVSYSAIL